MKDIFDQHCLKLSSLAYNSEADLVRFGYTPEAGFERFDLGNIQILRQLNPNTKTCYLAFAGSNEASDWWTNFGARASGLLGFIWSKTSWGKIHRGYKKCLEAHMMDILNLIPDDYSLVATGHSKGGAEAQLTAIYYARATTRTDFIVVTFGAPKPIKRIFSEAFKRVIRNNTTHYINPADGITSLPWSAKPLGKEIVKRIVKRGSEHSLGVYSEFFK